MSELSVSVVIPARDAARTIEATVQSVLEQTSPAQEILVVDDGSTDDTRLRLERFAGHLTVLFGPGRGVAAARNLALRHAGSQWVALIDADDRWMPQLLARARARIQVTPTAVACFCAARPVDPDGRVIGRHEMEQSVTLRDLLSGRIVPTTSASLIRRDAALAQGGFNEGFRRPAGAEDLDLWWRLAAVGSCVGVSESCAVYVVDDGRDARRPVDQLLELERDREEVVDRLRDRGDASGALLRLARAQIRSGSARYWLRAGHRPPARAVALRSVMARPTASGLLTLAVAFAPSWVHRAAVATRRRLRSESADA